MTFFLAKEVGKGIVLDPGQCTENRGEETVCGEGSTTSTIGNRI